MLKRRYFDLSFKVNNDFLVDFYTIFVKEGQTIYLDGAMHSSDTISNNKKYNYLVEHTGSYGVIEYYVVAFLKSGRIISPKLITAQLIR